MRRLAFSLFVVVGVCAQALAGEPAGEGAPVPKVPAKPEAQAEQRFGDWSLLCREAKDKTKQAPCTLVQLLIDAASKKTVFHLTVGYGPRGNLVLVVRAPLGVALAKGIEVTLGGQAVQRAPFTTCRANGCRAVLILSPALQQEMRKAERARVTVYALGGNPFQATASLKGFGDGLNTLDKRRGPS